MFRTVLVPLDGSENAERVTHLAVGFARGLPVRITLFTVIDPAHRQKLHAGTNIAGASDPEGAARRYLEGIAARLTDSGLQCQVEVASGSPAEAILSAADRLGVELIAMATHRGSALARGLLGSVTDEVIRRSVVPVLAIHPLRETWDSSRPATPETVVVPLDGSDLSELTVALAKDTARTYRSKVFFLRVVHWPKSEDQVTDLTGAARVGKQAYEYLAPFVADAQSDGIATTADVRVGLPPLEIVKAAEAVPNPIIVMGSRGESGLKRLVLGGVTDRVLRSSGVPVLVVPPGAGLTEGEREVLRKSSIAAVLSDDEFQGVARLGRRRIVREGETLGSAGRAGESIYILLEGQARLSAELGSESAVVRTAQPGDCFPLASLVGQGILVTSIQASTRMVVWELDRQHLATLCREQPAIGVKILEVAAET
ncbi:MAG: universal stress protein, partial [Chloroflexi bacterium]|nr:universal stress protein [Chloroflexota bacterium]